jgi:hypothetical protein
MVRRREHLVQQRMPQAIHIHGKFYDFDDEETMAAPYVQVLTMFEGAD